MKKHELFNMIKIYNSKQQIGCDFKNKEMIDVYFSYYENGFYNINFRGPEWHVTVNNDEKRFNFVISEENHKVEFIVNENLDKVFYNETSKEIIKTQTNLSKNQVLKIMNDFKKERGFEANFSIKNIKLKEKNPGEIIWTVGLFTNGCFSTPSFEDLELTIYTISDIDGKIINIM